MAGAAEAALHNPAIVAYFDQVESQAIDALLGFEGVIKDPETTLRLITVAKTVRAMRDSLHKQLDMRAVALNTIETLDRIENARSAR